MHPEYDQASPNSIEKYGKRLVNGTLRTVKGIKEVPTEILDIKTGGRTRGSYGHILEEYYYDIHPGNESAPDFKEAGVELKATPIKTLSRGGYSAKERLVLNMINFQNEIGVGFRNSSFMKKNSNIMLVSYLHKDGRAIGDHPVKIAELIKYDELPEEDRKIIFEDWEKIQWKIDNKKAHELSEGDTLYLGACTKGTTGSELRILHDAPPAKPRAYALKSGYMTTLTRRLLGIGNNGESILKSDEVQSTKTFEEIVIERFKPYMGMTVEEIARKVAPNEGTTSKSYLATLSRRIMGIKGKKIQEFENADVQMKTVQLTCNGIPKEDMSFPAFKFSELVKEQWDATEEEENPSTLKQILQKRFFFVVFACNGNCKKGDTKVLSKVFFWTMPLNELETTVKTAWEKAQNATIDSNPSAWPKGSDDIIIHVRPHGRRGVDTDNLPNGEKFTKQGFWLNRTFTAKIIQQEYE